MRLVREIMKSWGGNTHSYMKYFGETTRIDGLIHSLTPIVRHRSLHNTDGPRKTSLWRRGLGVHILE